MNYKPSKNPVVEELTKSTVERSINLGSLRAPKIDGKRMCVWCLGNPLSWPAQKYCSDDCRISANAWAYPQKEDALFMLLIRQNWKCNICAHSWEQVARGIWNYQFGGNGVPFPETANTWGFMKRLKAKTELEKRKPEVDHIIPIYKGGISIGLDNHQAICYTCHRAKTKVDLSGKRNKNE